MIAKWGEEEGVGCWTPRLSSHIVEAHPRISRKILILYRDIILSGRLPGADLIKRI